MRLTITREQVAEKTMFGGEREVMFQSRCEVELSQDERRLVDRYNGYALPIALITDGQGNALVQHTLANLIQGIVYKEKLVTEVIEREEQVKVNCSNAKAYLRIAEAFGGEMTYDI